MRDLFQSSQINTNAKDATNARITSTANEEHLKLIAAKLDRVSLMAVAAIELLEELGISESRIAKKMEEIDLRDGQADGRMSAPKNCPDCGNKVSARRSSCYFCGSRIKG